MLRGRLEGVFDFRTGVPIKRQLVLISLPFLTCVRINNNCSRRFYGKRGTTYNVLDSIRWLYFYLQKSLHLLCQDDLIVVCYYYNIQSPLFIKFCKTVLMFEFYTVIINIHVWLPFVYGLLTTIFVLIILAGARDVMSIAPITSYSKTLHSVQ